MQFPGGVFDLLECVAFRKDPAPLIRYRAETDQGKKQTVKVELYSYGLSVGSRAVLRDAAGAHHYGCSGAALANDRLAKLNAGVVPPGKRRSYLGFYDLAYRDVRAITSEYYAVNFRFKDEGSTPAHFQLSLVEDFGKSQHPIGANKKQRDNARQNDRLAVVAHLSAALRGPSRHICSVDQNLAASIKLLHAQMPDVA